MCKDLVLAAVHGAEAPVACIVKPTQVQHAVEGVQKQLHAPFYAAPLRLAPGVWNANDDLAAGWTPLDVVLQLERQDVGGAGDAHELCMKLRHALIVDERNR